MKHFIIIFAVLASPMFLLSCSDDDNSGKPKKIVNLIPKQTPVKLTEAQQAMVDACNDFTFDMFRKTNGVLGSRILSPLSTVFALAMVNAGAEGETADEIAAALGFTGSDKGSVNEFFANLIENLPKVDPGVDLTIANALFVDKRYTVRPAYQSDMQTYYKAEVQAVDFTDPSAFATIDQWCSRQTGGQITSAGKPNSEIIARLMNAVSFRADWTDHFDEADTENAPFTKEDGTQVELPIMQRWAHAIVSYNDNCTALCLPYSNRAFVMYVLLPDEGTTVAQLVESLTADTFNDLRSRMQQKEVKIGIPRFTSSICTDLIPVLKQMGVNRVFTMDSQLPYICDEENLFISDAWQVAKIEVDEQGTKTSAITVEEFQDTSAFFESASFIANRPFVYLIRENTSGTILFTGTYMGD